MKCPNCGAEIPQQTSVCEFCGSAIDTPRPLPSGHADLFQSVRQSAAYQQREAARRLAQLPQFGMLQTAIPVVFLCVFIAASLFISVMFLSMVPFAAVVPIGFVVIGVMLMLSVIGKSRRIHKASTISRPAIVVAKRTSVSGGGKDSSVSTHYHVTFEFEDGRRTELEVQSEMYSMLSERDAGVLFTKDEWVQDFDRVAG